MKIVINRLLSQFKGRQNNQKCWDDVVSVVDYWFKTEILSYGETIADWQCLCGLDQNPPEEQRANRLNVVLNVRFYNSVLIKNILCRIKKLLIAGNI